MESKARDAHLTSVPGGSVARLAPDALSQALFVEIAR